MKKIVFLLVCLFSTDSWSQDTHFSNFQNTPLYYNPAATGILQQGDVRVSNANRRQWNQLVSPARATNISVDLPLNRYRGMQERNSFLGLGLNIVADRYGQSRFGVVQTDLSFMGAIRTDRSIFSTGVSVGRGTRRIDLNNLSWDSQYTGFQYNSSLPTHENYGEGLKASYLNLSGGVMWTYNGDAGGFSQLGASYRHANQPQIQFAGYDGAVLPASITMHWKSEIPIRIENFTRMGLNPHILVGTQGPHMEIIAGSSLKVYFREPSKYTLFRGEESLELGAAYRYGDAVALLMNLHYDNFNLGFSYDVTTSNLRQVVGYRGGPEFSFTWYGKIKNPYTRRGR